MMALLRQLTVMHQKRKNQRLLLLMKKMKGLKRKNHIQKSHQHQQEIVKYHGSDLKDLICVKPLNIGDTFFKEVMYGPSL
jgi:hypothetical protein